MLWYNNFGCREAPFSKEISASDLWQPPAIVAIVDRILEALKNRDSLSLIGDAGAGKTTVLRAIRERLSTTTHRLTYCHNATLGRRDFYRHICLALGLAPAATAAAVFYAVSTHVQDLSRERLHPVFLLDEAHMLHQDTLDHLHILMNYDYDSRALLSLVLIGLPELEDRLALRHNRSLRSRLQVRLRIPNHNVTDTSAYLAFRLARVGGRDDVFTDDAIALLHKATDGAMRDLDRLATDAMRHAAAKRLQRVDAAAVDDLLTPDVSPATGGAA